MTLANPAGVAVERRRLTDPRTRKLDRSLRAAGGAVILSTIFDGFLAAAVSPERFVPVLSGAATVVFFGLLLMAVARALTFRMGYRCPECGQRAEPIADGRSGRRYECPRCNVEWTAGGS